MIGRCGIGTFFALGLVGLLMLPACQTREPGARKTLGNVTASVPYSPPEVIAATERALRKMEMTIISSQVTEVDGRVTARSPSRRPVDVRVTEDVDDQSRLNVRIGAFGDEDASIGLLRRIRHELEHPPQAEAEEQSADAD